MASPDSSCTTAARHSLLRWYRRRARLLPWRQSKAPYTVWVSEVMLQQTQIETVVPYYQRFLREFPTVERLAHAPLDRVLEIWSGLGYYRRARNLHRAARELVEMDGGRFPREIKRARSLPGVGDYTARAVLSIAYNQPFAVLDGNVARVMARFLAFSGNLHQPQFRRHIEENLDRLLSRRSPGNFNQALMELGQTVCLPRGPKCTLCPLRRWCQGFISRKAEDFPERRRRRQTEPWHMAAAVLHKNQQVMLSRGLDNGLLDDLWNFPSALGKSSDEALRQLKEKLHSAIGNLPSLMKHPHKLRHNITYRSIQVHVYEGIFEGKTLPNRFRWFLPRSVEHAAVSQLTRKIARKLVDTGS
jgi:A/G-specific adenine glycosylase